MGLFPEALYDQPEYCADNVDQFGAGKLHVARILQEIPWPGWAHHHQLDAGVASGGVDVHSQGIPGRAPQGDLIKEVRLVRVILNPFHFRLTASPLSQSATTLLRIFPHPFRYPSSTEMGPLHTRCSYTSPCSTTRGNWPAGTDKLIT